MWSWLRTFETCSIFHSRWDRKRNRAAGRVQNRKPSSKRSWRRGVTLLVWRNKSRESSTIDFLQFALIYRLRISIGGLLEECLRDEFPVLGDISACNWVGIFNLVLVDFVCLNILPLDKVHNVDFTCIVSTIVREMYGWTMAQPPVCIKSPVTPLTSCVRRTFNGPGGRTYIAGGVLFWMTRAASFDLVIILEKPSKSFKTVSRSRVRIL